MKPIICALAFIIVSTIQISNGERSKRQIPVTTGTYYPPGTKLTEDGVPVIQRPYVRAPVHYPGPQGLEHYTNFVNDPYVNTEDLASLVGGTTPQRPTRPELRSGYESYPNDRIRSWSSGSQQQSSSHQSQYNTPESQPQRYTSNVNTYERRYSGIEGNDEWEVASKGDNHITYRRRVTATQQVQPWQSYNTPTLQRFDTQQGQVN